MSADVVIFPGETNLPFDANVMLDSAKKADLECVIIIGIDKDGDLFVSTSLGDRYEMLWHLKQAEKAILE